MAASLLDSTIHRASEMTPGAALPLTEQIRVGDPSMMAREALLASDRNKWFLVTVLLSAALCFMVYQYIALSKRADIHREVLWVKMYPDGTYDMEEHDNLQSTEFLQSTVNSLLKRWVTARFSKNPQTVVADYTFANYFLSPSLTQEFVSETGFHAAQQAATIEQCPDCPVETYTVRMLDHYDQDKGKFANVEGTFYRTNLFTTASTVTVQGRQEREQARIVRVQWRLMLPEEVHAIVNTRDGQRWLDHNPIGLEILAYSDMADPSGDSKSP
ncbi:MAG: hypothetical protein KC643_31775 [Nitrospira sp.]|nr:hypothetical protein [Nitrospira sp.]MDR4483977.1 hypothetical protein [Nitrospirales bacterium]